jgi:YihY family inner membrane protein
VSRFLLVVRFLIETLRRFLADGCTHRSAAIAYYALLSFGPTLILAVWGVAHFTGSSPEALEALLSGLESLMPEQQVGALDAVREGFKPPGGLVIALVPVLVWTALLVFLEVEQAINHIFRTHETRRLLLATVKSFALLLVCGTILLGSFLAHNLFVGLTALGWERLSGLVPFLTGSVIPAASTILVFTFIYWVLPHTNVGLLPAAVGGLTAGILWEVAKHVFGAMVARAPTYGMFYGPVSVVVVALAWTYLSSAILLLGAEAVALRTEIRRGGRTGRATPV